MALTTTALVGFARASTTPGSITSWRATGLIALVAWVAVVAFFVVQWLARDLAVVFAWLQFAMFFLIPALLAFPVWTAIAAIRGLSHPERVVVPAWARFGRSGTASAVVVPAVAAGTAAVSSSAFEAVAEQSSPPADLIVPALDVPRPQRRGRAVLVAAGGVVVAFALFAVAGVVDQWTRSRELADLTALIEQSQDVVEVTNLAILAAFDKRGPTAHEAAQKEIEASIRGRSEGGAIDLGVIASDFGAFSPLPWHSSISKLRDDYLKHNDAWVERYSGMAQAADLKESGEIVNATSVDISTTFLVAERSAEAALPTLFAEELRGRLDTEFSARPS